MDYSALSDESEHPVESSPWSTSPRLSRAGFHPQSSTDVQSTDDTSAETYERSTTEQHHSKSSLDEHEAGDESSHQYKVSAYQPRKDSLAGATKYGTTSARDREGQQSSNRDSVGRTLQKHQSTGKSGGRTSTPQYKLHAKITGLERTGRKDLILRFDVHVLNTLQSWKASCPPPPNTDLVHMHRPIYPGFELLSFGMFVEHIPSSSNSPNISSRPIPRPSSHRCLLQSPPLEPVRKKTKPESKR